jgi:hypothetical protein
MESRSFLRVMFCSITLSDFGPDSIISSLCDAVPACAQQTDGDIAALSRTFKRIEEGKIGGR